MLLSYVEMHFISEMTCKCNGFGGLHVLLHET